MKIAPILAVILIAGVLCLVSCSPGLTGEEAGGIDTASAYEAEAPVSSNAEAWIPDASAVSMQVDLDEIIRLGNTDISPAAESRATLRGRSASAAGVAVKGGRSLAPLIALETWAGFAVLGLQPGEGVLILDNSLEPSEELKAKPRNSKKTKPRQSRPRMENLILKRILIPETPRSPKPRQPSKGRFRPADMGNARPF